MIRKLEYINKWDDRASYAYDVPSGTISGQVLNADISYLEDSNFLFDPLRGYIDESGNATPKLFSQLKTIERANEGTWEFIVSNVSRLDKKPLRGGRSRVIPTYYDVSGNINNLIAGVGDTDDCMILNIDQEREPDIMSKDLFISTMEGFSIGESAGRTSEIDYTNLLNPVNQDNVNNYYPVINHGYFYSGESEYYIYGNKQTEIIGGKNADNISGYVHFALSGQPNIIAPVFINVRDEDLQDIVANVDISNYSTYSKNSFRTRIDGISKSVKHELSSLYPWVYIVLDDSKEIIFPDVTILTLNRAKIDVGETMHGWINIIRPNKNFRTYAIDNPQGREIVHNMGTTDVFALVNTQDAIGVPQIEIINENKVKITAGGAYGTLVLVNMSNYVHKEEVIGFVSGTINHNLDIPLDTDEIDYYVDPWVFCMTSGVTQEIISPDMMAHTDGNNIYMDFVGNTFDGTVYILDFYKFNETGALFEGTSKINTDYFAFEEGEYYENMGPATPVHKMHPIPSNQKQLTCLDKFEKVRELDFLSGYYDGLEYPTEPVYITTSNEVIIPLEMITNTSGDVGNLIVMYEKDKDAAYEFRFRGTDASPVTWYNTDRIIAMEIEKSPATAVEVIPDENNIHLQDSSTRMIGGEVDTMPLYEGPAGDSIYGQPITNMNLTCFVTDDAGVSSSGETLSIDTRRNLYNEYLGSKMAPDIDFDIAVVDNTSTLLSLSQNILSGVLSGETISTISIFDEITFIDTVSDEIDIFDDTGYLFTTISGLSTYRIPFRGALYDEEEDILTHKIELTTDVFGTTSCKIGFHNDPEIDKISKLNVKAYVAGSTGASGEVDILIYPIERSETFGMVDTFNIPNKNVNTIDIFNDEVTLISGIVPTISTIDIIDIETYNHNSGMVERTAPSGNVKDVFRIDDKYIVYHDTGSVNDVIRYDTIDNMPAIADLGEYYGDN